MINRFKEQREQKGMSIETLSEKSGISVEELMEIEDVDYDIEQMSSYKAADIAVAMECFISDLIYG